MRNSAILDVDTGGASGGERERGNGGECATVVVLGVMTWTGRGLGKFS